MNKIRFEIGTEVCSRIWADNYAVGYIVVSYPAYNNYTGLIEVLCERKNHDGTFKYTREDINDLITKEEWDLMKSSKVENE